MKIIMIRHGQPAIDPPANCDGAGFEAWIRAAAEALPRDVKPMALGEGAYRLLSGTKPIALETARALFGASAEIEATGLLNEIPLLDRRDPQAAWPLKKRMKGAVAAWKKGGPELPENREQSFRRAEKLLQMLEKDGRDAILISHIYFLEVLCKVLKKQGYLIQRTHLFSIDYLERIRATKRRDHCGCCAHNCLLTEAKCQRGRDIAARNGKK